jgi:endogenous inhibitor of DNA gyrase (YacG/DUF329 family)
MADLGRWLTGDYRVAGEPVPGPDTPAGAGDGLEEDDPRH